MINAATSSPLSILLPGAPASAAGMPTLAFSALFTAQPVGDAAPTASPVAPPRQTDADPGIALPLAGDSGALADADVTTLTSLLVPSPSPPSSSSAPSTLLPSPSVTLTPSLPPAASLPSSLPAPSLPDQVRSGQRAIPLIAPRFAVGATVRDGRPATGSPAHDAETDEDTPAADTPRDPSSMPFAPLAAISAPPLEQPLPGDVAAGVDASPVIGQATPLAAFAGAPAIAAAIPSAAPVASDVTATPLPDARPSGDRPMTIIAAAAPVPLAMATSSTAIAASLPVGVAGPALQVFGAALSGSRHDERHDPASPADPALALSGTSAPRHQIAAVGDAQQAPLDLTQQRWPHAMIDRIEHLRDAADATDTRIRLIPDALGSIDVSMRQDGDTLHVHFQAEHAATAALIQDAQPRLAAIAEERGLRLGQSAVDAGTAGGQPQQRQQPSAAAAPISRAPAAAATDSDDEAATGGRLA